MLAALSIALISCITVNQAGPSTAAPTEGAAPTSSPTPTVTPFIQSLPSFVPPTPVGPRPVILRPNQIIMPVADFIERGWHVTKDEGSEDRWYRQYEPPSPADYYWMGIFIDVYRSPIVALDYVRNAVTCKPDFWADPTSVLTSDEVAGTPLAVTDATKTCIVHRTPNISTTYFFAALRNVVITTANNRRSLSVTESDMAFKAAVLAEQQIKVINRVSPP